MIMYSLTRILPLCLVLLDLSTVVRGFRKTNPLLSSDLSVRLNDRRSCPVHSSPVPVSPFYQLRHLLCRLYPHFHRIASLPHQSSFCLHFLLLHQMLMGQKETFLSSLKKHRRKSVKPLSKNPSTLTLANVLFSSRKRDKGIGVAILTSHPSPLPLNGNNTQP